MINKINNQPIQSSESLLKNTQNISGTDLSKQFGSFLNNAINQLNLEEQTVSQLNSQFIQGGNVDPHELLIASQKASLGLELTVEVRNKVIEAYQEIMRMQI
ncbi:flagellar hook-basal body complex protein FliE [Chengkuizengella axinellae]|uniref:Flagellar hook-basal body complex protein FliE n=1 Tax=Chengkuizengella axinellae TaxID=3064388 RepID=A0ABT9IVQ3_9BACL|nr:flagellar hook-basal body complex protein FliE [Chengkuizengella sp. 2205SS18-9]MDP5273436.1 flagellar hook-basal body complex protein FliE [Chengkuizengella sp. 2205SS18-9]